MRNSQHCLLHVNILSGSQAHQILCQDQTIYNLQRQLQDARAKVNELSRQSIHEVKQLTTSSTSYKISNLAKLDPEESYWRRPST